MTVEEAFATFDWATFHKCGHPVQRFGEVVPPCAYCWRRSTNLFRAPSYPPPESDWKETQVNATTPPFTEVLLRLKSYLARDEGKRFTGRIWTLEE